MQSEPPFICLVILLTIVRHYSNICHLLVISIKILQNSQNKVSTLELKWPACKGDYLHAVISIHAHSSSSQSQSSTLKMWVEMCNIYTPKYCKHEETLMVIKKKCKIKKGIAATLGIVRRKL